MPLRSANIIGSGPNGLAAAITLAQRGVAVTVYERNATLGGACSTAELTLPGFLHDVGSSVYPLGIASPFFRTLPLEAHGLRYIHAPAPLAHPFDDGTAALFHNDLTRTAGQFDDHDRRAWLSLLQPFVDNWPMLADAITHPLLRIPSQPFALANFGLQAMLPAVTLAKLRFRDERSRTLLAGNAAHAVLPLTHIGSSGAGLALSAAAHATGWPIAAGGAQSLANALASYFTSLGGKIVLNANIEQLAQLDPADATLFDTSPQALDRIAGDALSPSFRSRMRRFRNGPGAFKLDWALSAPIPWRNPEVLNACTVHLGGSLEHIAYLEPAARQPAG
ncbi:MAG: NAD(P)/FAD-dependent oxidoreductase, partial [Acidobacteriota bacterium]